MITAMIRVRSVLLISAISILMMGRAQAASITIDANGILLGAKDVIVNGTPYDVEFIDAPCADVFGGCDVSHFAFTAEADAQAASVALLEQVFLDGALGNFDSDMTLTNGCGHPIMEIDQCFVWTPYGTFSNIDGAQVRIGVALNTFDPSVDQALVSFLPVPGYDVVGDPEGVYAKWTAVSQSVPDATSTFGLTALSVALVLAMRRVA